MSIRIYKLEGGTGVKGAVVGMVLVGIGAVILVFGLALLVAVAMAGAALGAGVLLYRRLTGRSTPGLRSASGSTRLDPSLEVFAPEPAVVDPPARKTPDSLPPG